MNRKQIFANYNDDTIRVYQAYRDEIAHEAVRLQTFGSHFKLERMTWIKPSFLWMMYRCGWASKQGQENVLAIDIKREGFDEILSKVVLSTYKPELYGTEEEWKVRGANSPVRCQWDPERDIHCKPLEQRSIQLGIRGEMIRNYVKKWIVKITPISPQVVEWREQIKVGTFKHDVLPEERLYPVSDEIKKVLGMEL